ncbi:unnamed protein product [[Candida] boidinii]|nr:unnamed protein product [[Candida] boidinii]
MQRLKRMIINDEKGEGASKEDEDDDDDEAESEDEDEDDEMEDEDESRIKVEDDDDQNGQDSDEDSDSEEDDDDHGDDEEEEEEEADDSDYGPRTRRRRARKRIEGSSRGVFRKTKVKAEEEEDGTIIEKVSSSIRRKKKAVPVVETTKAKKTKRTTKKSAKNVRGKRQSAKTASKRGRPRTDEVDSDASGFSEYESKTDLDDEDKIPDADGNDDDSRNASTGRLSRSKRRKNLIGSINKSSSRVRNESAIDDDENEEEEEGDGDGNDNDNEDQTIETEEVQQRSPKRRRISIVRRKSTGSKTKLRRKSITKPKKKKLIPLDQLNLTEAEIKADNKYYINPISQKLTKVSVEEFRGLDFVDDKVVIDNIGTILGVSKAEDPKLLEKFVINDQEMTLDQLCKPSLPIGKISDNFVRAVEGDKLRAEQSRIRSDRRRRAREQRVSLQEIEEAEELRKQKEREEKAKVGEER